MYKDVEVYDYEEPENFEDEEIESSVDGDDDVPLPRTSVAKGKKQAKPSKKSGSDEEGIDDLFDNVPDVEGKKKSVTETIKFFICG